MTTVDPDPLDLDESGLAAIGKHWGLVLTLGIVSVLIGIMALVWPGATILVVAILLAVLTGLTLLVQARQPRWLAALGDRFAAWAGLLKLPHLQPLHQPKLKLRQALLFLQAVRECLLHRLPSGLQRMKV